MGRASTHARIALALAVGVVLLAPAAAFGQADYRTVVIFGDTQTAVAGGEAANYADFEAMIDWVIANKHTENIDFVLHAGDIVNLGSFLPTDPVCIGAPVVGISSCLSQPICDPEPPGCYLQPAGMGTFDCMSCAFPVTFTPPEWDRFVAQWSRFDPDPGTGWLGIPTAIVRGNHDNVGVVPATDIDVPGYLHHFGESTFENLETAFVGSDRAYEHLETNPVGAPDGHAWRFELGGRPVLVVGPSYDGGIGTSQAQIDWMIDLFSRYPDTPTILLVHDLMQHSQIYHAIVQQAPSVAPQLFLVAQGHIRRDMKWIDNFGGQQILRTVSDWSRTPSPGGSYLTVIRFYLEPGQPDEIEAFTYSPVLDQVVPDADKTIPRQEFPVPEPSRGAFQVMGLGLSALARGRYVRRLGRGD